MKCSGSRTAQMHTLEGITAATIVLMSVFFMTQALAITPSSSSTASKAAEAEMQQLGDDVLAQAHANGTLKTAVLDWNDGQNKWEGASVTNFRGKPPNNEFGDSLKMLFDERAIAYNIEVHYPIPNSSRTSSAPLVTNGEPTDNAVLASQKVVLRHENSLTDGTDLTDSNDNRSTSTYPVVGYTNHSGEYRPGLYNVVEVRMTIWRK